MDGHGAGAVVALYENNYNASDFFEVDYVQELPLNKISKNEKVYFVDYSFSLNTVDVLNKVMKITSNIIWIDHHASSLELLEKYPGFKSISGIVQNGISGAALTYMYLYNVNYASLPLFLKYISDFDCWHLKMPNTMQFKYGVECYDYSVHSDFWVRFFDDTDDRFLNTVIDRGAIAKQYSENVYKRVREQNAYEADVNGYKGLILNRDGFSELFGEQMDKYDVCVLWHYENKKYVYSIYTKKDNIDVSKIAEKYGGGGHKGAAGFSSEELMFK
jgi:oligoribonuclease NrnB/cAMP/cGMP phosphodiesterase (DHH superfamily)